MKETRGNIRQDLTFGEQVYNFFKILLALFLTKTIHEKMDCRRVGVPCVVT